MFQCRIWLFRATTIQTKCQCVATSLRHHYIDSRSILRCRPRVLCLLHRPRAVNWSSSLPLALSSMTRCSSSSIWPCTSYHCSTRSIRCTTNMERSILRSPINWTYLRGWAWCYWQTSPSISLGRTYSHGHSSCQCSSGYWWTYTQALLKSGDMISCCRQVGLLEARGIAIIISMGRNIMSRSSTGGTMRWNGLRRSHQSKDEEIENYYVGHMFLYSSTMSFKSAALHGPKKSLSHPFRP